MIAQPHRVEVSTSPPLILPNLSAAAGVVTPRRIDPAPVPSYGSRGVWRIGRLIARALIRRGQTSAAQAAAGADRHQGVGRTWRIALGDATPPERCRLQLRPEHLKPERVWVSPAPAYRPAGPARLRTARAREYMQRALDVPSRSVPTEEQLIRRDQASAAQAA